MPSAIKVHTGSAPFAFFHADCPSCLWRHSTPCPGCTSRTRARRGPAKAPCIPADPRGSRSRISTEPATRQLPSEVATTLAPPTNSAPTFRLCSQGDHTILSTARPVEVAPTTRPRAGSAGPSSTPVRKTPSPRPTPSPTNLGMGSSSGYTPRTKTPPPPPPMLSSRSSAAFNERERRSPKSSERHSPTQGKGASSPTEAVGAMKPKDKGHIRSMSASTTPTPPPQPKELCVSRPSATCPPFSRRFHTRH